MTPDRSGLRALDGLVACGEITGYTVEVDISYLRGPEPTLTYSMYDHDAASRSNLQLFAAELRALGARVHLVRRWGRSRWGGAGRRRFELTAVCRFDHPATLERGLSTVRRRYVAGAAEAVPASWRVPDVRVCGAAPAGTIAATAHELALLHGAAVVLGLDPRPPLPGMRSHPVRVLDCWAAHLAGPASTVG